MESRPPQEAESSEEENYFISLSDLMTGVVFIFVILLCAFAFNYHAAQSGAEEDKKKAKVAQDKAAKSQKKAEDLEAGAKAQNIRANEAQDTATEAQKKIAAKTEQVDKLAGFLRDRDKALGEMLRALRDRLKDQGVDVQIDEKNGILHLPDELLFESGSDKLKDRGLDALKKLAGELLPVLKEKCADAAPYRIEALFVEGHTDNNPIHGGRFRDNLDLSTARATGTYRKLLDAQGSLNDFLNPDRKQVLGVSGYGETRPAADNGTDAGRAKNRRIDLRFIMAYPAKKLREVQDALDPVKAVPPTENR